MKLIRSATKLKKLTKEEDYFADASAADLICFMWELTAKLWSLGRADYVERRLQRNVTNLIRQ